MQSCARVFIVPTVEFTAIGVAFLKSGIPLVGPDYFLFAFIFVVYIVVFGAIAASVVLSRLFYYGLGLCSSRAACRFVGFVCLGSCKNSNPCDD